MKYKSDTGNTGHGKLLLFGEHSAVFGYPAVGIPLPLTTEVLDNTNSGILLMNEYEQYAESINSLIIYAQHLFKIGNDEELFNFKVVSSVPPESGLGSSAALCTALVKYLIHHKKIKITANMNIWNYAHKLEHFFHGTPSGIDTGLASLKNPTAFYFEKSALPRYEELPHPQFYLLFGFVPRINTTKSLVEQVKNLRNREPKRINDILEKLGEVTETSIQILRQNTINGAQELGLAAKEAHKNLQELEVSIKLIDNILETAELFGSLGGKLSGAGGGGAFWFISDSPEKSENLKLKIISKYNCPIWIIK